MRPPEWGDDWKNKRGDYRDDRIAKETENNSFRFASGD